MHVERRWPESTKVVVFSHRAGTLFKCEDTDEDAFLGYSCGALEDSSAIPIFSSR